MNDRGSIVIGIDPLQGMSDNRFSEIAFSVGLFYAQVNGIFQKTVKDDLRAEFHENDGHAGILTHRDPVAFGDLVIFFDLFKDVYSERAFFGLDGVIDFLEDIRPQIAVSFKQKVADGVGNKL
jgi:hypothetical protein